jgi:hypothetical protein
VKALVFYLSLMLMGCSTPKIDTSVQVNKSNSTVVVSNSTEKVYEVTIYKNYSAFFKDVIQPGETREPFELRVGTYRTCFDSLSGFFDDTECYDLTVIKGKENHWKIRKKKFGEPPTGAPTKMILDILLM